MLVIARIVCKWGYNYSGDFFSTNLEWLIVVTDHVQAVTITTMFATKHQAS